MPAYHDLVASPKVLGAIGLLSVSFDTDAVTAETFDTIVKELGEQDPGNTPEWHLRLSEPFSVGGRSGALNGLIGVHDYRQAPWYLDRPSEHAGDSGFRVHVNLDFRCGEQAKGRRDPRWEHIQQSLATLLGTVEANVALGMSLPADRTTLAVSLPIELPQVTAAGFSHVSGVRLTRADDDQSSEDLYSVVLQLTSRNSVSLLTTTSAALAFGPAVLQDALASALPIAALAVPSLS